MNDPRSRRRVLFGVMGARAAQSQEPASRADSTGGFPVVRLGGVKASLRPQRFYGLNPAGAPGGRCAGSKTDGR